MIDSKFRTIADHEYRAIAGLSMGAIANHALSLMNNLDIFSYYGGFSGGRQLPKY